MFLVRLSVLMVFGSNCQQSFVAMVSVHKFTTHVFCCVLVFFAKHSLCKVFQLNSAKTFGFVRLFVERPRTPSPSFSLSSLFSSASPLDRASSAPPLLCLTFFCGRFWESSYTSLRIFLEHCHNIPESRSEVRQELWNKHLQTSLGFV